MVTKLDWVTFSGSLIHIWASFTNTDSIVLLMTDLRDCALMQAQCAVWVIVPVQYVSRHTRIHPGKQEMGIDVYCSSYVKQYNVYNLYICLCQ